MTSAIQISTRRGDDILVIGGDNAAEFIENLNEVLGPQKASALAAEFPEFFPDGTERALGVVKDVFPGASPVTSAGFRFNGSPQGDFVRDKWGNLWHTERFEEAPPCQCGTNNQGKLALKKGRSQAGKDYTMWACANTYERKAGDGCPSIFNDRGKDYPA